MTALHLVPAGVGPDPDVVAFERWARDLRGLRPETIRVRNGVLGRLSLYLGKPLREATQADLLRWEQTEVAGRVPETRRAYVSHVRAFYRWALVAEVITTDPSTRLTNPKLARALPRPISDEDLRTAVAAAPPKIRLMLLLGAFCGLRCQEIAGLHWMDLRVDPSGTTLLVRAAKGGNERVVPVPEAVMTAITAWGRRRSGPMFYGRDGAQISPNAISQGVGGLFVRLGIAATAHQLRHRYATTAYQLTKDLRMVQELLGHSSPTTTARYAAYDKAGTAGMVEAMDAAWAAEDQP